MMAQIDDTAKLKMTNLKNNPPYPFALQCQLRWSKNVQDKRGAPYQILLGSGNHRYCILLALGIYFELWIESGRGSIQSMYFVPEMKHQSSSTELAHLPFERIF